MVAAFCHNTSAAVDSLIKHGASLLSVDTNGMAVVHAFCAGGKLAQLQELYKRYPSVIQALDKVKDSVVRAFSPPVLLLL